MTLLSYVVKSHARFRQLSKEPTDVHRRSWLSTTEDGRSTEDPDDRPPSREETCF